MFFSPSALFGECLGDHTRGMCDVWPALGAGEEGRRGAMIERP